jgi:hypothetical protein
MPYTTKLALLGLILAAAPASAADPARDKAAAEAKTKYCIEVEASTGSRINKMECRTKAEWALLGVDVGQVLAK